MANTFAPFGFIPDRRLDGAAPSANMSTYLISGTNSHSFFKGDPVTLLSSGFIDVVASGSTPIQGVFIGCEYASVAKSYVTWSNQFPGGDVLSGTNVTAYVIDDPWITFKVQVGASGAVGGPTVQADIGTNFGFQFGTGNTSSGLSGAYLDYSNKGTSSTLPFRLLNMYSFPPGYNGYDITTAGNIVEVALNNSAFKSLTGI